MIYARSHWKNHFDNLVLVVGLRHPYFVLAEAEVKQIPALILLFLMVLFQVTEKEMED